jgi:hypothetical protein
VLFQKMHQRILHQIDIEDLMETIDLTGNQTGLLVFNSRPAKIEPLLNLIIIAAQINYVKFLLKPNTNESLYHIWSWLSEEGKLLYWLRYLASRDLVGGRKQADSAFKLLMKAVTTEGKHEGEEYLGLGLMTLELFVLSSKYDPLVFLDQSCLYLKCFNGDCKGKYFEFYNKFFNGSIIL